MRHWRHPKKNRGAAKPTDRLALDNETFLVKLFASDGARNRFDRHLRDMPKANGRSIFLHTLLIDEAMMRKEGWDGILMSAKQVAFGIGTWGYHWSRDPGWSVKDAPNRYLTVWPWYTGQAHRAGLLVHPWTIDDRWEMWMVSFFGADGFFTNRPDLALLFYGRADHIDLKPMWEKIGY